MPEDYQPAPMGDSTLPLDAAPAAGAAIGPYRLLEKLGEGGMGEVWLAEQTAPIRRRVAVKLVRTGMGSREVLARFQSERQALALMDHPAIAKVFDAGSTPDGSPYFVMEYVPGMPITDYCDKHRLGMRQRLALFIQVCQGVQHAHQKAVIHRDLKPSNILVAEVDGSPAPKIIDFGVAKAVSQKLTAETMFTQRGALIGTPEYMSPEQADSAGEDIDTRTDVYSLGVVLYELLVGALPLDLKQIRNLAFHELLRQLRDEDAPRPSTKLRTLGERSSIAARNRRTEPGALTRQLRGDLDAIALKALEKDRSRRYGSPSDLAADIGRYLNDEPVQATVPSLAYRAHKFVRRHRWSVGASAALALALIALAVSMTIQSARIARERDRANREAEAAERVADFLAGIFTLSDPDEARGNSVTAREILDKGSRDIESSLSAQPVMRARMMASMGRAYEGLGLYDPAARLIGKAFETRKKILGPQHPDTLIAQRQLARLRQYQGKYTAAAELFETTYGAQKRVLGADDPQTLVTANALGSLYCQQGRYKEAEKLLLQVLDANRRVRSPDDPETLAVLHNLGMAYDGLQQYAKEEAIWRQLLESRRRVLGADHPSTNAALQNLAYVQYRQKDYAGAEKLQRQALQVATRVQGPEHPDVLMIKGNLANTLQAQRRLGEAEKLQREVLTIRQRTLGPDNPDTLFAMNNLANVLASAGRYREARDLYLTALAGERRVLGDAHPEIAFVYYNLSAVEASQAHRDPALAYLREAVTRGYTDLDELTTAESWKALRADPEYQALVNQIRSRAAAPSNAH
jgi:non-specific serine/threonine protein kinase/serine/threonine-protein kinase